RYRNVTGVQTCALPISILFLFQILLGQMDAMKYWRHNVVILLPFAHLIHLYIEQYFLTSLNKHMLLQENEYLLQIQFQLMVYLRSEERRVGKESGSLCV